MRPKVYVVELSDDEREALRQMLRGGSHKARTVTRARILLLADEGKGDAEIVTALHTSMSTVGRIRTSSSPKRVSTPRSLRHRDRAANRHWTGAGGISDCPCMQRPAGRAARVDDAVVGGQTGHAGSRGGDLGRDGATGAEKRGIKPWQHKQWCIPAVSAEFVWRMEDVLDLYAEAHDPARPVVCMDELPYQLVDDARPPLPCQPGVPRREDYEYIRRGTCNLFGCFEPHAGRRQVVVTERRTAVDFAQMLRVLVDEWYPDATCVRLVLDNLNTHTGAAVYEAFPAHEARRIMERLEWHYTPKHGSWLNQMEVEWSVLTRQCIGRRIGDVQTLQREVAAWETARNAAQATVQWRFTTDEARRKLARLYPS